MEEFEKIRQNITDDQQRLLDEVWLHFRKENQWVPTRALHSIVGNKQIAQQYMAGLGGSIIFEQISETNKTYELTLLGILLTKNGLRYAELISKYLKYAARQCFIVPLCTHIDWHTALNSLDLDKDEVVILGKLLSRSSCFSDGGIFEQNNWNAKIPENIEDLPENVFEYVFECSMRLYDPHTPIGFTERLSYLNKSNKESSQYSLAVQNPYQEDFISAEIIRELQSIANEKFDFTRLVKYCKEINDNYKAENYAAVIFLSRAVLDHCPPIFGQKNFETVVSNHGGKTFKSMAGKLDESLKKIADHHIHKQIGKREFLPVKEEINFSNELNFLLGRIIEEA